MLLLKLKKRGKTHYEGDDEDYEINELLGDTFGEAQVRRIDNTVLTKKEGTDNKDIPDRDLIEHVLQKMKEGLVQPDKERSAMQKTIF